MPPTSTRARIGWAFYDWANSPYTTLVVTFVFPAYFASAVVGDPVRGQELWGYAMGLSGLLVALTAPVLGAVADAAGRRKPWIAVFTLLCALGAAGLWFVAPSAAWIPLALVLVVVGNWGYEAAGVFYNAMLPGLAPPQALGRLSGWAWGFGYAGGLAALVLALAVFVMPAAPLLPKADAANIRALGPLTALWLGLFSLPLFLWVPDHGQGVPVGGRLRAALASLGRSLRELRGMGPVGRFLLANMLYGDGLSTLFAMGGVYVAGAYGFSLTEVLSFGVLLNVTAGLGAAGFAWMDDRAGSKATVMAALVGLLVAGAAVLVAPSRAWVWAAGAVIGIFVGPAQAASRTFLARLAPPGRVNELFGLYALSGKATSFIGPWAVGMVTAATGSQTAGMAVILALFAAGLGILASVRAPAA